MSGESASTIGLTGREVYTIAGIADGLKPGATLIVQAAGESGKTIAFSAYARIDTPEELVSFKHGGILPYVLRQLVAK